MDLQQIVQAIYTDRKLNDLAIKASPTLALDLMGYLAICLLENPQKTKDLYNRGKLFNYSRSIIYLSRNGNRSTFSKLYGVRDKDIGIDENHQESQDEFDYDLLDSILKTMEKEKTSKGKFPYEIKLFEQILEHGYQAVSVQTGIPMISIYKTISKFKNEVKKRYKSKL